MKTLRRTAKLLLARAVGALARIATRPHGRPPRFLVGNYQRFDGNALHFALHCAGRKDVRVQAVGRDAADVERLKGMGIPAVRFGSLAELFAMARADYVFTAGHTFTDFSLPIGRAVHVRLYHGMPLKAVGNVGRPSPDPMEPCDFAIATSPLTEGFVRAALTGPETPIWITGEPKTDRLRVGADVNVNRPWLPLPGVRHVVGYVPTWRHDFSRVEGGDYAAAPETMRRAVRELRSNAALQEVLLRHQAALVVKPHPWDYQAEEGPADSRVIVLEPRSLGTEELMLSSDVLVSDYSAALVDGLILGRPVVAYVFDLDEYWSHRGSPVVDFRALFRDIIVDSADALAAKLDAIFSDPTAAKETALRLHRDFHAHADGRNSERIVERCLAHFQKESASP